MKNYYAILELPVGCGVPEIAQAYRRLAGENGDNAAVVADLNEAYAVLTNPARRADYDRAVWGETFSEAAPAPPPIKPNSGGAGGEGAASSAPTGFSSPPPPPSTVGGAGGQSSDSGAEGTPARCPMGAGAQCPVLQGQVAPADAYCPECGYQMAGLNDAPDFEPDGVGDGGADIRLEEPGGRVHRLQPGLNTVGRETADVLLPDKTVSRRHARLEVSDDGTVTLEDLSSTNGTQVGGDVLAPHIARVLQAGDRVRFGSVATVLHLPARAEAAPNAEVAPPAPTPIKPHSGGTGGEGVINRAPTGLSSPPPPPSTVGGAGGRSTPPELGAGGRSPEAGARAQLVETREEDGRTFLLVPGVTTFGRRADNSVVLPGDPYVSGSHAQIIADGDVFRLTDVGSTNGTLLNGRRLAINEPEALDEGDVVLIGGTALRFEKLGVAEESPTEKSPAQEVTLMEAEDVEAKDVEVEDVKTEDVETRPDTVPAEPRQRMAQEYDVPDDIADTGIPTRAASPHEAPTQNSPTEVER